jgi:hypothetical protein
MISDEWLRFETGVLIQDLDGAFRFVRVTLKSATCSGTFYVDLTLVKAFDCPSISKLKQVTLHALDCLGLSLTLSAYLSSVLISDLVIGLKTKKLSSASFSIAFSHIRELKS